jgi:hypothetical protein
MKKSIKKEKKYEKMINQMLVNQKDWIGNLSESTLSGSIFTPQNILLPIIRRSYPTLMANNWISIQPMGTSDYWDIMGRDDFDFN